MNLILPPYISLAQRKTPLQLLARLSNVLDGPRIWVKRDDLTGSVLSGNKVRKLEFLCAKALSLQSKVLITSGGVQSNHCRATAFVAAQLGLDCHLILREEPTGEFNGNLLLDQLSGARITKYPKSSFAKNLSGYFEQWEDHYQAKGLKPYSIPTGGSNGIGVNGYLQCVNELEDDFNAYEIHPELLFCASGSGGTQAGLSLGFANSKYNTKVVGIAVCDNEKYFFDKVSSDIRHWEDIYRKVEGASEGQADSGSDSLKGFDESKAGTHIETVDSYVGAGYGVANEAVFNTMSILAKTEGLVLDPVYTGKAFMGMLEEIKKRSLSKADDVVFVHTGGAFGVFPYAQQLKQFYSV